MDIVVANLTALSAHQDLDAVFAFDAVHGQVDPAAVLRRVHDALAPGGTFFMLDIAAATDDADNLDDPYAPWIDSISTLHCMTVSLAEGGAGLGSAWGEAPARQMLTDAGSPTPAPSSPPGTSPA